MPPCLTPEKYEQLDVNLCSLVPFLTENQSSSFMCNFVKIGMGSKGKFICCHRQRFCILYSVFKMSKANFFFFMWKRSNGHFTHRMWNLTYAKISLCADSSHPWCTWGEKVQRDARSVQWRTLHTYTDHTNRFSDPSNLLFPCYPVLVNTECWWCERNFSPF